MFKYFNVFLYFLMATLMVSDKQHRRWKIFCANKGVKIYDATEIALDLAMLKVKRIKLKNNHS